MKWLAVALSVLLVAVLIVVVTVVTQPPNRPTPQPTVTATPSDPLAWYRSLPTATPGCPKTVDPGLEPFYPHCF
jgi:type IV secretory pathway protease TraF